MHNINITLASHNQAQQGSKTKLQNKLLNQRKTVKSQPCTIEKLENKAPELEKHRKRVLKSPEKGNTHTNWKQTEYKDIQQKNITFSSHSQPNNRAKPN